MHNYRYLLFYSRKSHSQARILICRNGSIDKKSFSLKFKVLFFLLINIFTQVGEVPVEKSDIFVQYLQDNVPAGVTVNLELVSFLVHPAYFIVFP